MTYTLKKFEHVQIHQMYMIIFSLKFIRRYCFSIVANKIVTYMSYTFDSVFRALLVSGQCPYDHTACLAFIFTVVVWEAPEQARVPLQRLLLALQLQYI